jgi:hypothetical protein
MARSKVLVPLFQGHGHRVVIDPRADELAQVFGVQDLALDDVVVTTSFSVVGAKLGSLCPLGGVGVRGLIGLRLPRHARLA